MSLYLHNLKPSPGSKKKSKRVGRGGKRGTYSGRGIKGQRSRSGGKSGLQRRGMRQLVERTHKLPGFKSIHPKPAIVSLANINAKFKDGEIVNPQELAKRNLVNIIKNGVKILSNGKINVKITVENCQLSAKAKEKITKAGGEIKMQPRKRSKLSQDS